MTTQQKINNLWDVLEDELGNSTLDLVKELVKLELLAEQETNQ